MANDFKDLYLPTMKELIQRRMDETYQSLILSPSMYEKFQKLNSPEEWAKREAAQKAEADRLAAIEAAKSPAQKRLEKQNACDHEFDNPRKIKPKCILCGFTATINYVAGYTAGHNKGYDAGRDSVECE